MSGVIRDDWGGTRKSSLGSFPGKVRKKGCRKHKVPRMLCQAVPQV